MKYYGNYINCHVIVYDENENPIANTTVLSHDKIGMKISIACTLREHRIDDKIALMIIMENGVHEYRGTIRNMSSYPCLTEIALFNGHVKENRGVVRRIVNTDAFISSLVFDYIPSPLLNPLKLSIVNLSTTGALISAKPDSFRNGACIEIVFKIGIKDTIIYGKIVRIRTVDVSVEEYGCRFI